MKVVALCCSGPLLPRRLRTAHAITEDVYVADHGAVRRHTGPADFLDPPSGKSRFNWGVAVARYMYDLTSAGDRVYVLGFEDRAWVQSLAVLRREVVAVHCGERELAALDKLERWALAQRQEVMFG